MRASNNTLELTGLSFTEIETYFGYGVVLPMKVTLQSRLVTQFRH